MATGRFSAETMPEVTVADRPSGDPTATTSWPTCRSADVPNVAGVRPETPSALITARSSTGSAPTTVAVAVVPSLNWTWRSVAPSMTWLLVRIRPSADRMTPEPSPSALDELDSTDTTDGRMASATCWTEPVGACVTDDTVGEVPVVVSTLATGAAESLLRFDASAPPPNPARSASATVEAAISVPRPRGAVLTAGCAAGPAPDEEGPPTFPRSPKSGDPMAVAGPPGAPG